MQFGSSRGSDAPKSTQNSFELVYRKRHGASRESTEMSGAQWARPF